MSEAQEAALDAMVANAEELGLYDEPPRTLSEKETRVLFERSIARSHASPQGLAHLFPGLRMARGAQRAPKTPATE